MDLVTLSQIANPILQTLFIAVIGLGYYFTIRATWATVAEMRAEHAAGGGRPLVTVSEDYANLPNINLIVQNVGGGPAKDSSFEFSAPVESSDGLVLSELPFFEEGLTSLAPGAKIGCYWDTLRAAPCGSHRARVRVRLYGGWATHWSQSPSVHEPMREQPAERPGEIRFSRHYGISSVWRRSVATTRKPARSSVGPEVVTFALARARVAPRSLATRHRSRTSAR